MYHAARDFERKVNRTVKTLRGAPADLKSQLVRTAGSVPRCIAEGFGRGTRGEELRFLRYARGSLDEARHDLKTLVNDKFITKKVFGKLWNLAKVIERMLTKLIRQREE